MKSGIDGTGQTEDTILMVTNVDSSNEKFHYHVWDIDGNATDLEGNVDIVSRGMWVIPMKTMMQSASAAVKSDLTAIRIRRRQERPDRREFLPGFCNNRHGNG